MPEMRESPADPIPYPRPPTFDRIARLYRTMEYFSFGPILERCRFHHIPALTQACRALVLGDGDGRFLARLLAAAPTLHADAVDASPAMLGLLRHRISRQRAKHRANLIQADARTFHPPSTCYDLVVTHFFLDCLTEAEADRLIARIRPHLAPGAQWLVSEFQTPVGPVQQRLARALISALYAAFRLLTGLTVRRIPPWPALLVRHGFARTSTRSWLGGLLVSERWQLHEATTPHPTRSHQSMPLATEPAVNHGSIPGVDPSPEPFPNPPPVPSPDPAPGPPPDPDPEPYPGPLPTPQPVT
jgi:ubiquinone/menaquinone biosynthesis C-methylase UbiE